MNLRIVRWVDTYLGIPLTHLIFYLKKIFRVNHNLGQANYYKKILLVKFWGIGNVIMLLPAAYALKEKYPQAQLDFLTLANNKEVSAAANIFDNIYTLDLKNLAKFVITFLRGAVVLKNNDYDLVIDFEQFARFSAIFCSLIGKKKIIGFNTKGQHRHFLYTEFITYNNNIHITKSFYRLAELAGAARKEQIEATPIICSQAVICETEDKLRNLGISREDIIVILHVGTSENFSLRQWPAEYFAGLADKLINNFSVRVIFSGLANESFLVNKAISRMENKTSALNLSGRLDFNQLISLIKLSDLIVSADTAPVHLGSTLSVPTVGLYGPNTPLLYGPWGAHSIWFYKSLDCSPCITNYNAKINKCRHPQGKGWCMRQISVDEVFSGIKRSFFDENAKFCLKKLSNHEQSILFSKKHTN